MKEKRLLLQKPFDFHHAVWWYLHWVCVRNYLWRWRSIFKRKEKNAPLITKAGLLTAVFRALNQNKNHFHKILCCSFFLFAVTKINDESLLIVCCRLNINFILMISSSELICLCASAYPRSGLFSVTLFVSGHNMLIESGYYLPLWLSLLAAIICSFRFFKRSCRWTTGATASL